MLDGFVKSPPAALRFNPALLDKDLPFWEIGVTSLRSESETFLEKYLRG